MKPAGVICDSACGCPVPCAGGIACKCASGGAGGGSRAVTEHKKCSCGEHCGCNPCTCDHGSTIAGAGKGNCKCGPGCNCTTCAA